MKKILLPVDGSDNSLRAVQAAIELAKEATEAPEIHLLNVQLPIISGDVKMFVSEEQIKAYYHDEGIKALARARAALDAAGVPYHYHIGVGPVAETIAAYAKEKDCNQVIMGARGLGLLTGLLLGSVSTKVTHLVDIPVTLIK